MACIECNDRGFVILRTNVTGRVSGTVHKNVTVARRCPRYVEYFKELKGVKGTVAEDCVVTGPQICGAAVVRHREIIDREEKKGGSKQKGYS